MRDSVRLVDPHKIRRNRDNPRLVFRPADLEALEASIGAQGILVPLTVYEEDSGFRLLDGERRWRCARKLGLPKVPVIVQPKPARLQNIMMMFAIHNARTDWDPLPTALKLRELEQEFARTHDRHPKEAELAGLASMSRGEVRRLRKLQNLPAQYQEQLLAELEKPRAEQQLRVDHVIEAMNATRALRKRGILTEGEDEALVGTIITKFRRGVIDNTVAPRKLARLARAVDREEFERDEARKAVERFMREPPYSIEDVFRDTIEKADFEHGMEQLAQRLVAKLEDHRARRYRPSETLRRSLELLADAIRLVVSR